MTEFWKFSKSTVLTLVITGVVGTCVLAFAYHLRHYTEILSGVIGGLTIILGMVTAEWLRSAREEAAVNELRRHNLMVNIQWHFFNAEFFLEGPFTPESEERFKTYSDMRHQLNLLAIRTRWPQPNAKRIRQQAIPLAAKWDAMARDAMQNGHLWSAQKRYELYIEAVDLLDLILGGGKKVEALYNEIYLKSRETAPRKGMPMHWLRQEERESN